MFKWYKSGILEIIIFQIPCTAVDLGLSGVIGIDVDIGKKSSHSNESASATYRYISGILSF